jgi:DNA replication and repair protein RecF
VAVLRRLWLTDFRNYESLDISLSDGRVLFTGANGQGKSNVLEAIAYLGSLGSFRGAPPDALIRAGADEAVIRAEVQAEGRELLLEAHLIRGRANRIQVNKQKLGRARELIGIMPTTVFGPDDLELIKGGPGLRRRFLDDLLVQLHPRNDKLRTDVDKILKQRNALLRSSGGRLTSDIEATLAVWNDKLSRAGHALGDARLALVERLSPRVNAAYAALAGAGHPVRMVYAPEWLELGLSSELEAAAKDELRRGTTLVGPHRDELEVWLSEMPARTHASQGEQRTLSLALRIAGHHELAEVVGTSPVLLLDDVFSELDSSRATSLLGLLVADQTMITTASPTPELDDVIGHYVVTNGTIEAVSAAS